MRIYSINQAQYQPQKQNSKSNVAFGMNFPEETINAIREAFGKGRIQVKAYNKLKSFTHDMDTKDITASVNGSQANMWTQEGAIESLDMNRETILEDGNVEKLIKWLSDENKINILRQRAKVLREGF